MKMKSLCAIYQWTKDKPLWMKLVIAIPSIIIVFGFARLNHFGNAPYFLAKKIWPFYIEGIDPPRPLVQVSIAFKVNGNHGKKGGTYHTGDSVLLSYICAINCWISMVGIDANGSYAITGKDDYGPILVNEKSTNFRTFKLNERIGKEVIYIFASSVPFNYEKVIKPELASRFENKRSKGTTHSEYYLELPLHISQAHIYFNHIE